MNNENGVKGKEFEWDYVYLPDIFQEVMGSNFRIKVGTLDCVGFLMRLEDDDENTILEVFAQIRSEKYKNIDAFIASDHCKEMMRGILGDVVKSGFMSLVDSNCSIREIGELMEDMKLKEDKDGEDREGDVQDYVRSWLQEQSKRQEKEDRENMEEVVMQGESVASLNDKYHTPEKMAEYLSKVPADKVLVPKDGDKGVYESLADKLDRMGSLMTNTDELAAEEDLYKDLALNERKLSIRKAAAEFAEDLDRVQKGETRMTEAITKYYKALESEKKPDDVHAAAEKLRSGQNIH